MSLTLVTVQGLRAKRFLTGLFSVYASCSSNHALAEPTVCRLPFFVFDSDTSAARSLGKVEKPAGLPSS